MALGTASTLHGLSVLGSCCLTERKRELAGLEGRGNETNVKRKKKSKAARREGEGERSEWGREEEKGGGSWRF